MISTDTRSATSTATAQAATKRARRAFLLAAALGAMGAGSDAARAADLYWDANGDTTTATGGTGQWLGGNTWRDGSTTGTLGPWVDGSDAKLPQASGTLTLSGPVAANSIEFLNTSGAYTLTGSSISVGDGGIRITNPTGEQRIASALGSTATGGHINYIRGVSATNTSRLALQGVNTFAGNINVTGTEITALITSAVARLDLNNAAALPAGADINFSTNNGAISNFGPNGTEITFAADQVIDFNAGGSVTTQNGAIGAGTGNTITVNSVIAGNVNLWVQSATGGGAGTVVLGAQNTYTGHTTLNTQQTVSGGVATATGIIRLGVDNALPVGTSLRVGIDTGTFGSGALDLNGLNQTVASLRTGTNATSAANSAGILNGNGGTLSTLTITGDQTTTYASTLGTPGLVGYPVLGPNPDNIKLVLSNTHTGSLTLTRTNFYQGGTDVLGGNLTVNNNPLEGSATGFGTVTVGGSGSIGGNGRINGNVVFQTGPAAFHPGGTGAVEDIQLDQALTLAPQNLLNFEFGPTNYDKIFVGGNLNLPTGTDLIDFNLSNLGGLVSGTYDLINYSGSLTGDFASLSVGSAPAGATYTLLNGTGVIQLQVEGAAANRTWTGAVNGTWDVNGTSNWNGTGSKFLNGDNAIFDDSGNNTTITIAAGGVLPGNTTFNNNGKTYTFSGGPIGGSGGVTLTGGGTVVLNNANTFTGAVNIGGGTLAIGSGAAIASASAVNLINNAIFQSNGAAVSTDRPVIVDATGGTINVNTGNALTLTSGGGNGGLSGSGAFTKTGDGLLDLNAVPSSPLSGLVSVNGGTLRLSAVNSNGVTGSGTGAVTVNSGGTLEIANIAAGAFSPGVAFAANFMSGSTLRATGNAFTRGSGAPAIDTAPGAQITFDVPSVGDKLTIGNSVRNAGSSGQTSGATITVTGAGHVQLASGGTSESTNATHYNGSWVVNMAPTGILSAGPVEPGGFGEVLNALGYTYGDRDGVGNPITISGGTFAMGAEEPNAAGFTPPIAISYRSPITLDGGNIASTGYKYASAGNPDPSAGAVTAQVAGEITLAAGKTSSVLLYDPVQGPAGGSRSLNIMTDPNAAGMSGNLTWGAGSTLVADSSTASGGTLRFQRTAGTVSVGAGAALQINTGSAVELAGSQDALSDGTNHVNVVNNGALNVTAGAKNVGGVSGGGATSVNNGATLNADHVRGASLTVSDATVVIRDTDGTAAGVSNVADYALTGTGRLDLRDNKLVTNKAIGTFTGDPGVGTYSGVQGDVQRAYNFGAWDQPGLTTSEDNAGQNAGPLSNTTTIGVATASQVLFIEPTQTALFQGQTVTGASTIAMYTYAGDLNFDGLIDGADYGTIDNSVQFPGTDGYANGDFNYDGVIDGADYGIIDNAIQFQGAPFPGVVFGAASASSGASLSGVTAVPEPSACGLALMGAAAMLGRRRRRTK